MWYNDSTFYQIYPFGFCGTPQQNNNTAENTSRYNIREVEQWIPHLQKLSIGTVLFNPVFESDSHGYDTRGFTKIDNRLGTNEDFAKMCKALHEAGIRVMLDGVFNHVGRGFWAFQDVLQNREASEYKDWFHINFSGNSNYNDNFWYEGWEGHYELVKLNLQNYAVVEYLLRCVSGWIREFDIDGLRLDVAYCLDTGFLRHLRAHTEEVKPDFFLVGEMLHGNYAALVQDGMLHSVTNYECYKGLYSSLNTNNMFEIAYSLNRQFGAEQWTLYKGMPLFNFVDNHDVTRAASVLSNPTHLPLLYGMLFGMPGLACIYYGSEWGVTGIKHPTSDDELRPCFDAPVENDLFAQISRMSATRSHSAPLRYGDYRQVYLTNNQFIFERRYDNERVLIALNSADEEHAAHFNAEAGTAIDLLTGLPVDFGGGLRMPPHSVMFMEMERKG